MKNRITLAVLAAALLAWSGVAQAQYSWPQPTPNGNLKQGATIGESLGPELITLDATCTGWTLASGWTCASGTLAHDGAGTGTATYTAAGVVGTSYRITHTSTITVGTGGYTLAIGGGTTASRTAAVTAQEDRVLATATTVFTITPGNTAFRGVISAISVKAITSTITPGAGPVIVSKTFADATANEAALRVVGNQTGAAGDKSLISAHFVGTAGSGTEYLYDGYNGSSQNWYVTPLGLEYVAGGIASPAFFTNTRAASGTGAFIHTGAMTNAANAAFGYSGKPAIHSAGTDLEGVRMIPDLSNNHTGGNWISFSAPDLVSPDPDIVKHFAKCGTGYDWLLYGPSYHIKTGSAWSAPPATSVLTGSINPTASTTLTGVGTRFLSELMVGDKITVSGETRTVTAIASDTSLTVDTATTDTADDASVDRYPVGMSITGADTSVATDIFVNPAVKSSGNLMDLRVGNASKFSVSQAGAVTGVSQAAFGGMKTYSAPLDATVQYVQLDTLNADTAGPPASGDCDASTEVGRMTISTRYSATADVNLWVCVQTGASTFAWYKTALTAP